MQQLCGKEEKHWFIETQQQAALQAEVWRRVMRSGRDPVPASGSRSAPAPLLKCGHLRWAVLLWRYLGRQNENHFEVILMLVYRYEFWGFSFCPPRSSQTSPAASSCSEMGTNAPEMGGCYTTKHNREAGGKKKPLTVRSLSVTIDITFLITNTLLIPKGGKVLKPHRKPIF